MRTCGSLVALNRLTRLHAVCAPWSIMDFFTWVIVLCILSSFIYLIFFKKRHDFRDWGIPQPDGELPILGIEGKNLYKMFFKNRHLGDLMRDLYDLNKDAKYIGAHQFINPVIILRDIELVKAVLVKDFDHFADRKGLVDEKLEPMLMKNLASLNGERWREIRQLLSPAFTSSKIKTMFKLMEKCAENFTNSFIKQGKNKEEIDTKDAFTKYTNDVIATCAFGIEIDSMKDPKNEFYVYGREVTRNDGWKQIIGILKFVFMKFFPRLAKIFNVKLLSPKISDFFVDVIGSVVKTRDEKGITRPDMLQLMMDARGKTSENVKLDILEMTAQAFVFFLGGLETTSAHMCLVAHMLAINPEIQEKLHAEIDATVKETNGRLTYDAITHMPYLDAVFQETLRLHPQAVFLTRSCSKSYELPPTLPGAKPYLVQPGIEVFVPVSGIHRDSRYYENPEKFVPERFLGKNIMTSGDVTSLGFGMGPRMCIGNRFAILETKVLFFNLLKKCRLEPCKKTCNPLKYSSKQFGPVPAEGFWLKISERNSSN